MNQAAHPGPEMDTWRSVSRARADRMIDFVRRYAETRINSRLIDERRCITPSIILDVAREGMFGLQVPEMHSGQGLTTHDTLRVMEQLSAIDPNLALVVGVQNSVGILPVRDFAADSIRDRVLPLLASGRALCTIAASEPGAAGNFHAISARAVKQRDGSYVLNGEKRWISLGAWSEYISVFAKLEDELGRPLGITGFLVKNGTPGYIPGEEALTYGMKGLPQNHVRLENLHVAPDMLLGKEGNGSEVAQAAFMSGRLYVSAMSLAAMKRCLQIAERYARGRPVASGRLIDNGVTHAILNDCLGATRAVQHIIYDIADRLDSGDAVPKELYFICKVMASELMWEVVDRSVQMLGARGFLDTNVVGQYFRDFRLIRIFEGPTELVLSYIGLLMVRKGDAFIETLTALYGTSTAVELLQSMFDELRATAPASADPGTQVKERHVLYASLGQLACWGALAAVASSKARATGDPCDLHAAMWCERRLRDAARRSIETTAASQERMSPALLEATIAGYEDSIGVTEQAMPGEDRDLDHLLRRPVFRVDGAGHDGRPGPTR